MKRSLLRLALAVLPALALSVTAVGAAHAASTSPAPAAGTASIVTLPDHTRVKLPLPFDQMSPAQLGSYGIKSGAHGLATVATASTTSDTVTPSDASGWNGNVRIVVKSQGGKGPTLIDWETEAISPVPGGYLCTIAGYWVNYDTLWAVSNQVCGTSFYSNVNNALPHNFGNTHVCNTWVNINGKPCEHVF